MITDINLVQQPILTKESGIILLEMQLCGRKRLQRTMTFGIPAIGEDKNCIAGNYPEQVGRLLYNCDHRGQGKDSTEKVTKKY